MALVPALLLAALACGRDDQLADIGSDAECAMTPIAVKATFTPVLPDSTLVRMAHVTRAEVATNGDLIVLDGSAPALFRVDARGRTTVLLDRGGPGPGELHDPRAFTIDSRGHIWVASPTPPSISEFDSAGTHLRSLRYWRAAMVVDMAVDARDQLLLAYRMVNPMGSTYDGPPFATVERLTIGDSITATALDSLTSASMARAPYFNAPVIEFSIASPRSSSPGGAVVATSSVAYQIRWFDSVGRLSTLVAGCQDGVDNAEKLQESTMFEGGYTIITWDQAFAQDGSLYHLTANVRRDGSQRLDRFTADGRLSESLLVPSRARGGAYLSALLPTADSTRFWGIETGGALYVVRLAR